MKDHAITAENDVSFILWAISGCRVVAEAAAEEKSQEASRLSSLSHWIGKYLVLCLIHALVDRDEIKRAFLTCHDLTGGRMEIENSNTAETRGASVWQLLANKWNDPLFLPISASFPDLHAESFETVSHMHPATAEKCEGKWQTLNLQLSWWKNELQRTRSHYHVR